jgi:hypothetical protein
VASLTEFVNAVNEPPFDDRVAKNKLEKLDNPTGSLTVCENILDNQNKRENVWNLAMAPTEPKIRGISLNKAATYLEAIIGEVNDAPLDESFGENICRLGKTPQFKVLDVGQTDGNPNTITKSFVMYLKRAISCFETTAAFPDGETPQPHCAETFADYVTKRLVELKDASAETIRLNLIAPIGNFDLASKTECEWPFAPNSNDHKESRGVFNTMNAGIMKKLVEAVEAIPDVSNRAAAAKAILKLFPSFKTKLPRADLVDYSKLMFAIPDSHSHKPCEYRPDPKSENVGALIRYLEAKIRCDVEADRGKTGVTQTDGEIPFGVDLNQLEESLQSRAENCKEPVFSAIAQALSKLEINDVKWFEPLDPSAWDAKQQKEPVAITSSDHSLANQMVKAIKVKKDVCATTHDAFVSKTTAEAISERISALGNEATNGEAEFDKSTNKAYSKQRLVSLHVLAALPQETKLIARYLINKGFSSDALVKCDKERPSALSADGTVDGNYLVPLYLFLLSRYKCISGVEQEYVDHLTNPLTEHESKDPVVTNFIHHSQKKSQRSAIPQEDRDVADPNALLEILSRMYSFEKNLNRYFNAVSLAGITAGETAVRVQLQASLAELAQRALAQYSDLIKMEKDAETKIGLTMTALKTYVTKDDDVAAK